MTNLFQKLLALELDKFIKNGKLYVRKSIRCQSGQKRKEKKWAGLFPATLFCACQSFQNWLSMSNWFRFKCQFLSRSPTQEETSYKLTFSHDSYFVTIVKPQRKLLLCRKEKLVHRVVMNDWQTACSSKKGKEIHTIRQSKT